MKILTLHYQNHDANVTYFDGQKAHYCKLERVKQIKKYFYHKGNPHAYNNLHHLKNDLHFMHIDWMNLDVIAFTLAEYQSKEEDDKLNWKFDKDQFIREVSEEVFSEMHPLLECKAKKYYRIEHHFAHKMSADWLYGDMDKALVIDGTGDYDNWCSVFANGKKTVDIQVTDGVSIGHIYAMSANQFVGKNVPEEQMEDVAGKLMGLQSYGDITEPYAEWLRQFDFPEVVTQACNELKHRMYIGSFHTAWDKWQCIPETDFRWWHQIDWVNTWQKVIFEKVIEFMRPHFDRDDKFSFSGGVAHNVVFNEVLAREYPNSVIPPCVGDEGMSIGAMYAMLKHYDLQAEFPSGQASFETIDEPDDATIDMIVDRLANGKVVAVCAGDGEIGPRALGNRSILYRTDMQKAPEYFNRRSIKKREWWRPYGISILEEDLTEYLDIDYKSPYMLHTAKPVNDDARKKLVGVLHVDDSVRYQTVSEGWYHKLLVKFKEKTAMSCIINTSMNSMGQPLVHTKADALDFAVKAQPDLTVIGNDLYEH